MCSYKVLTSDLTLDSCPHLTKLASPKPYWSVLFILYHHVVVNVCIWMFRLDGKWSCIYLYSAFGPIVTPLRSQWRIYRSTDTFTHTGSNLGFMMFVLLNHTSACGPCIKDQTGNPLLCGQPALPILSQSCPWRWRCKEESPVSSLLSGLLPLFLLCTDSLPCPPLIQHIEGL